MKDSGIEWIGEIPEEWFISRLRFLVDITTGEKDTIDNEEDGTLLESERKMIKR